VETQFVRLVRAFLFMVVGILMIEVVIACFLFVPAPDFGKLRVAEQPPPSVEELKPVSAEYWSPPDSNKILSEPNGELIFYGRQLIQHTAEYLGPNGKVMAISNGMNCQNCHLEAGTRAFGNNKAQGQVRWHRDHFEEN